MSLLSELEKNAELMTALESKLAELLDKLQPVLLDIDLDKKDGDCCSDKAESKLGRMVSIRNDKLKSLIEKIEGINHSIDL